MTETLRKPAIFSVDDPRLVIAGRRKRQRPNVETFVEAPADNLPAVMTPRKRRVPWGTLFWSALSGLVVMALGLAVTNLVEDLYARAPWLGAIGLALALLAGLALLVVVLREIVGLARLATVEVAPAARLVDHRKRRPRRRPRAHRRHAVAHQAHPAAGARPRAA